MENLRGPVNSFGGPYIILSEAATKLWRGSADWDAYQSLSSHCSEQGAIKNFGVNDIIILNTPDPLYFKPLKDGGLFIRIISFDADDDNVLEKLLEQVLENNFQPIEGKFHVRDKSLLAFDAACPGTNINASIQFELDPGEYTLSFMRFFSDNEGAEFLITRIQYTALE